VLRTGKPANSDLVYGLVAGRLIFLVNVPVIRGGRIRYVLNAAFSPDVMTRPPPGEQAVRRRPGVDLGPARLHRRALAERRRVRRPPRAAAAARADQARSSGVAKGESPEGMALYYSYARSPVTGWTASVGAERGELDRAVRAAGSSAAR
jgi:hypothetical protein